MASDLQARLRNTETSILFMQRDHAKTLEGLHAEIQKLQEKCADLTFRLAMEETSHVAPSVPLPASISAPAEEASNGRVDELESILRTRDEDVLRLETALRDREGRLNAVVIQIDREREGRLREAASFADRERALKSELDARAGRVAFLTAQLHKIKVGSGGGGGTGEAAFITLQPHPNPQGTSSSTSSSNHRHMQSESMTASSIKERRRGGLDALVAGWGAAADEEANGSGAASAATTASRHLRPVRPPSSSSSAVGAAAAANRRSTDECPVPANTAPNPKRAIGARTRRFRQVTQEDAAFGDEEGNDVAASAASGSSAVLRPKPPVLPPIHGPNNTRGEKERGRGGANGTGLNYNNNNNSGSVALDSDCQSGDEDHSSRPQQLHLSPQHQQQRQFVGGASFEDVSIIDLQASANANSTVYAKENLHFNGSVSNNVKEINNAAPGDLLETTSGGGVGSGVGNGVVGNMEGPVLVRKARVRTVSRRELARHQHHHQASGKAGGDVAVGGGVGGGAEVGVLALDAAEKVPSSITGWRQGKVRNNPTTP